MSITPLRCRHCGGLEDLVSVTQIGPYHLRLLFVSPKRGQAVITSLCQHRRPCQSWVFEGNPEVKYDYQSCTGTWCWACWTILFCGPMPERYDRESGRRIGRGESLRGVAQA
jgi:hypothetical protein